MPKASPPPSAPPPARAPAQRAPARPSAPARVPATPLARAPAAPSTAFPPPRVGGAGSAPAPAVPAEAPVDPKLVKAAVRAQRAFAWGLGALALGIVNLGLVLFGSPYVLVGIGALFGVAAVAFALMARGRLKRSGVGQLVRRADIGGAAGGIGVAIYVVSFILMAAPTVISEAEELTIPAQSADGIGFEMTGESSDRSRFTYEIVGAETDSFTACVVSDDEVERWVQDVTPESASGMGCTGPGSSGQGTATIGPGSYWLMVFCWNESAPCTLEVTSEGS